MLTQEKAWPLVYTNTRKKLGRLKSMLLSLHVISLLGLVAVLGVNMRVHADCVLQLRIIQEVAIYRRHFSHNLFPLVFAELRDSLYRWHIIAACVNHTIKQPT